MLPYFKFANFIGKNKDSLTKIDSLESEIDLINQKLLAIENWYIDLERLRQYKPRKQIKMILKKKKTFYCIL